MSRFGLWFDCPAEGWDFVGIDKFNMTVGEGDIGAGLAVTIGHDITYPAGLVPPGSTFKKQDQIRRQLIRIRGNIFIHRVTAWTDFVGGVL